MQEVSTAAAMLWMLVWMVLTTVLFMNIFVSILASSILAIKKPASHRKRMERAFPVASWHVYFQAKIPWFWKDPDTQETVARFLKEHQAWRRHLAQIDGDKLRCMCRKLVEDGSAVLKLEN